MCSKLSAIGSKSEFSHLLVSFHLRHPGVLRAPPPWLVEGARQNFQRLFQLFCFILKAGLRACVVWVSSPDRIRRVPFLGVPREFVRDRARGRRVVQEVPAHGHHAGDFFGHQGRMFQR